jgi:hypothetical protein
MTNQPPFVTNDFNINIGKSFPQTSSGSVGNQYNFTFKEYYHDNLATLTQNQGTCYDSVTNNISTITAVNPDSNTAIVPSYALGNDGKINLNF